MTTSRLFNICAQSLGIIFGLCGASWSELGLAKTTRYELTATMGNANLSGKMAVDWALMINGGIPAPTLEFTEGDDAADLAWGLICF